MSRTILAALVGAVEGPTTQRSALDTVAWIKDRSPADVVGAPRAWADCDDRREV
jgi:hypothetical protein